MQEVHKSTYSVFDQQFRLDLNAVRLLLLTDGYPPDPNQHYIFSNPDTLAWHNSREVLSALGVDAHSFQEVLDRGILIVPSLDGVVPPKVSPPEIASAAERLKALLGLLPNLTAIGLMGDVAIATFNQMHKGLSGTRLIPAGSTYKLRRQDFFWGDVQVFPSYLYTGKSYVIERSKRQMVAEDMQRIGSYLQTAGTR